MASFRGKKIKHLKKKKQYELKKNSLRGFLRVRPSGGSTDPRVGPWEGEFTVSCSYFWWNSLCLFPPKLTILNQKKEVFFPKKRVWNRQTQKKNGPSKIERFCATYFSNSAGLIERSYAVVLAFWTMFLHFSFQLFDNTKSRSFSFWQHKKS